MTRHPPTAALIGRRTALLLAAFCATGALAQAPERGTRDEAKAMVDAAVAHVSQAGAAQAFEDFTVDKTTWTKKDLYVMVYDDRNVALAHGANRRLIGRDMSAVKDAGGQPVVPALNALATHGGGWYDYDWPDPVTKTLLLKSTYVRALPHGHGFVGVGVYR
jgi:signal transduction histidine kinase